MDTIFVWLIVGVAAILPTIVVAVFVIVATNLPDFSDFGSFGINDVHPPHRFLSLPKGTKDLSVRLSGTAFRFSKKAHLYTDELFWKNFEDGPWKWDTAARYAGSGSHPGYYFAFTPREARSEILHYLKGERDLREYEVLAVQGEMDNILDLTSVDNVETISNELGILNNRYDLLGQLVGASTGGNHFTDEFGAYAYEHGYAGILFFSARNIDPSHRDALQSDRYYHEDDELIFKGLFAQDLFEKDRNRCLVIFDGAELLRSIAKYRVLGQATRENSYFGADKELIVRKSESYGSEYQAQRRLSRGQWVFPRPWRQSEISARSAGT